MMDSYGSVTFARHCLTEMASTAAREFEVAFRGVKESPAKQFLRKLGPQIFADATR